LDPKKIWTPTLTPITLISVYVGRWRILISLTL